MASAAEGSPGAYFFARWHSRRARFSNHGRAAPGRAAREPRPMASAAEDFPGAQFHASIYDMPALKPETRQYSWEDGIGRDPDTWARDKRARDILEFAKRSLGSFGG